MSRSSQTPPRQWVKIRIGGLVVHGIVGSSSAGICTVISALGRQDVAESEIKPAPGYVNEDLYERLMAGYSVI